LTDWLSWYVNVSGNVRNHADMCEYRETSACTATSDILKLKQSGKEYEKCGH